jgi:RimK-like ATP-grasp domain
MILFCGIASEPPLAMAIAAAERLGIENVVFHQRDSQFCDLVVDHRDGRLTGVLWAREREWPLEKFTGVYTRLIESGTLPENRPGRLSQSNPWRVARSTFLHQALGEWIDLADCRVVNRTCAMASNVSKVYQMQLISQLFPIPSTLVTNEPEEALEFVRLHGKVVYKSISSVRSIVREWSPDDEASLPKIRALPTQFQAYISGTNVRVHVVGDQVFATEIISGAVDYRYAQRDGEDVKMRPVWLPPEICKRCCALSALLKLPFCGIDLKRTEAGDYYCFEVNPSPAYSYYEEYTRQPIATALVEYLANGSNSERTQTMSVQVIENWALIRGKITQIQNHPDLTGYMTASIEVGEVSTVEGYPNLFEWAKGRQIAVNIPASRVHELGLGIGDQVIFRVRKSGPESAFADPGSIVKSD